MMLSSTLSWAMRVAGAALCLVAGGCQTAPDTDDSISIEDAKKRKIIYRGIGETATAPSVARGPRLDPIGAPPRDIGDIRAALAQASPTPVAPDAAGKIKQPPPATVDNYELAKYYWERGRAAGELGLATQELEDFRRAAEHARGLDRNDISEDWVVQDLAGAETRTGNFLTAARLRERVIELNAGRRKVHAGQLLGAYGHLVAIYVRLGERDKARAALARAEAVLADARHKRAMGFHLHSWPTWPMEARATLLESEGQYAEAEALRRQVVSDRRKDTEDSRTRLELGIGKPGSENASSRGVASAERQLIHNLVKQQRLLEAEGIARKRVYGSLRKRGRNFPGTGHELRVLSGILAEQGRYTEARELADTALDIFLRVGLQPQSLGVADARRARAAALTAEGRYADALAEFERMRAGLAADPALLSQIGRGDLDWVLALARTGQSARAVAMAGELLKETRERLGEQHYETAEALGFLGMAQAADGRRAESLQSFAAAVPVLIAGQDTTSGAQRAAARVRRLVLTVEAYIELLAETQANGQSPPGIDAVDEAFRLADFVRGSSVLRALSSGAARAAATDPRLAELVRREQTASQRLNAVQDLIATLVSSPPDQRSKSALDDLRKESRQLEHERREHYAAIARDFPSFAELMNPKPATLERVRGALLPGEVLVSVYVGARRSFVWAVPKTGEAAFATAPLGETDVSARVARLRKSVDSAAATLGAMPSFDVAAGYELYRQLLQPVESAWREGDTLLFVPHRALAQLPLALLPTASATIGPDRRLLFEGHRDIPWLVRKVAVAQLPTANAVIAIRSLPPGDPGRRAFAGFGDPLFSAEQAAAARETKPAMLAARGVTRHMPLPRRNLSVARVTAAAGGEDAETAPAPVANSSRLAQVPRLPDTADEIREIAAALKADEAQDVFLQLRATEGKVKATSLVDRRVLVFATHGLVPGELDGLDQPALALTAPELVNESGDGLLTMEEVLGLKLNADWVVLSACNTAAGDGKGGEAVSGLGRAFFYAGSRALLVTQWPVETTSARALTTGVFQRQAKEPGLTRPQALRATMLALIDGPGYLDPASGKRVYSYAHPMFWAPYTLVGDAAR
jgi:CHAT domain-containing protein/tetratricopeptide (TPR) repeat protein